MHICLFDIDGTLVLTGGAGQTAFAHTLTEVFGISEIRDVGGQVQFAGRSDRAITMDLFALHGVEPSDENWRRFLEGYVRRLEQILPTHDGYVLPGVTELLAALADRGDVAIGLLTGNVREGAQRKLSHYGLWHWFPFGGFGDVHLERNKIAAAALSAARVHIHGRLPPGEFDGDGLMGEMVVIGDTVHDVTCGQSIGARCVAVPTGHTTPDVLRGANPDLLVDTLEDVDRVLKLFD